MARQDLGSHMAKFNAVLSKRSYPARLDARAFDQSIEFYDKGYGFSVPYILFGLFGVGVAIMSMTYFQAKLGLHLQVALIGGGLCILVGVGKSVIGFFYSYNTVTRTLIAKIVLLNIVLLEREVVCDSSKVLVTQPCKLSLVPNGLASWNAYGLFFRLPAGRRVLLACQPTFEKLLPHIEQAEAVFKTKVTNVDTPVLGRMAR